MYSPTGKYKNHQIFVWIKVAFHHQNQRKKLLRYHQTGSGIDMQNSGVGKRLYCLLHGFKNRGQGHGTCVRLPSHCGNQLFLLFTSCFGTFETPTYSISDWQKKKKKSKITSSCWYLFDLNYLGESCSSVISIVSFFVMLGLCPPLPEVRD